MRSLALFRVLLAGTLLVDLWLLRAPYMTAHYTDNGVMPRSVFVELSHRWIPSLHAASGELWVQLLLWGVATLFALMMLVGYRTRFATVMSWALLISLQGRNYMVLQGGDVLLRLLLFWGMFLPLGACWSMDVALDESPERPPRRVTSAATVAALFQTGLVYLFTAALKSGEEWFAGTAVYYALSIEQFTNPLGQWLQMQPLVDSTLTYFTIILEWVGPLVAFIPVVTPIVRVPTVLLFMGMHLGFAATMSIGLFPIISCTSWVLYIPTAFWDRAAAWLGRRRPRELTIHFNPAVTLGRPIANLLATLAALPRDCVVAVAGDGPVADALERSGSRLAVAGRTAVGPAAVAAIVRASPVLFFLAPVASVWPLSRLNRRRSKPATVAGRWEVALRPRPLRWRMHPVTQVVVGLLLVFAILWNVGTLPIGGVRAPCSADIADCDAGSCSRPGVCKQPLYWVPMSEYVKRSDTKRNDRSTYDGKVRVNLQSRFPGAAIALVNLGHTLHGGLGSHFAYALRIDQAWNMFAPRPLIDDGWWVIIGTLNSGRKVDLFARDGQPFDPAWCGCRGEFGPACNCKKPEDEIPPVKPAQVAQTYPGQRWRKYMMNLWMARHKIHRQNWARWRCWAWNQPIEDAVRDRMEAEAKARGEQPNAGAVAKAVREHPDRLIRYEMAYMREDTPAPWVRWEGALPMRLVLPVQRPQKLKLNPGSGTCAGAPVKGGGGKKVATPIPAGIGALTRKLPTP